MISEMLMTSQQGQCSLQLANEWILHVDLCHSFSTFPLKQSADSTGHVLLSTMIFCQLGSFKSDHYFSSADQPIGKNRKSTISTAILPWMHSIPSKSTFISYKDPD